MNTFAGILPQHSRMLDIPYDYSAVLHFLKTSGK